MHTLDFIAILFVTGALAVASIFADLPLVFTIAFCVFLVLVAAQVDYLGRQRRYSRRLNREKLIEAGSFDEGSFLHAAQKRVRAAGERTVQTMQIKVEADTSQATAAIEQLEKRARSCIEQIESLNRLAIINAMEKP